MGPLSTVLVAVFLAHHGAFALRVQQQAAACPNPLGLSSIWTRPLLDTGDLVDIKESEDCIASMSKSRVSVIHTPITWIHLHNFGGTFMCQEAHKQGLMTGPNNCNVKGDECSSKEDDHVYCKARGQYGFSAIEREVQDEDLECTDRLYGVMLRDPIAGARTTFTHNKFDGVDKDRIFRALRNGESEVLAHTGHKCLPKWDTYQHFDNFATRVLSSKYNTPAGKMTRHHLEKAKARLRSMSVVMILEDLGNHLPQLETVFGWDLSEVDVGKKTNFHPQNELDNAFSEEEEDFLRNVNHLDYELYAFGASLAQNLTADAQMQ